METLGQRLASERRKAGKSIMDVEKATHIRAGLLEAMEADDHARLPSRTYARGYIRSYAKYLGVDPGPFLELYEQEVEAHAPESNVSDLPAQIVPRREHAEGMTMRTAATIAAAIALLALALWGVSRLFAAPVEPTPVPPTADPAVEVTPTPTASPEPTAAAGGAAERRTGEVNPGEEERAAEEREGDGFALTVEVEQGVRSWMVVVVDGEQVFAGMLEGETREWDVRREAVVSQIGKPTAVRIAKDGETVRIPPSEGVPSVTLTQDP